MEFFCDIHANKKNNRTKYELQFVIYWETDHHVKQEQ